jgi:hypothetical protein
LGAFPDNGEAPPPFVGWLFVGIAAAIIVCIWTLAIALLVAGRSLANRKRYTFCLVVAGVECIFVPLGTTLGVFTLIVLLRDSVKRLFETRDESMEPGASAQMP